MMTREDILDDTKEGTRADRFVKWINRRNVRRRRAKKEIRTTTERVLSTLSEESDSAANMDRTPRVLHKNSSAGSSYMEPLQTPRPSMQWECISDAGDMELCVVDSSTTVGDDSLRSNSSVRWVLSNEELSQARSMPTLAETLSSKSEMTLPFEEPPLTGELT